MQRKNDSMCGVVDRRTIYSGGDCIEQVQKRYKLDAVIKKRGRPGKEEDRKGAETGN
jgi:hypothetical protein